MLLTFINLGATEVWLLILLIFSTVVFAAYKVLKNERGISMIFWLVGIFGVPPIFAMAYLLKTYAFGSSLARSSEQ